MTETEWDTKEENIQQHFTWALGPEATHQSTQTESQTDPVNVEKQKLIKSYNRYCSQIKLTIFLAKQTNTETPKDH